MGHVGNGGGCRIAGTGNRGHHNPKFVARHVDESQRPTFFGEQAAECQLFLGTRRGGTGFIRLCIDPNVTKKPVKQRIHTKNLWEGGETRGNRGLDRHSRTVFR